MVKIRWPTRSLLLVFSGKDKLKVSLEPTSDGLKATATFTSLTVIIKHLPLFAF